MFGESSIDDLRLSEDLGQVKRKRRKIGVVVRSEIGVLVRSEIGVVVRREIGR